MKVNIERKKQILRGPSGLKLELDASQIYPDDPGQGTPALVVRGNATASLECALQEGELGWGEYFLSPDQSKWLNEIYSEANAWLDYQYKIKGKQS